MTGRSIETRHLQALLALAQELHFGRAAQRLNITQPALSQLIRDLEVKVGFRVVERTTRRVILTPAGNSFLQSAEEILLRLDRAIETAQEEAGRSLNTIRIGTMLPTAFEFLPSVLSVFRTRYSSAAIHIETRESPELASAVEAGALHVALLRPPQRRGALQIETLRREPFVAAIHRTHRLAGIDEISLADLAGETLIRFARPGLHQSFDEIELQLEAAGVDLMGSRSAETTLTALAFVSAGDGVALVPAWVTRLPWNDLLFRPVRDLAVGIELAVAWEGGTALPIVQHFLDVCRRVATRS